MKRIVLALLLTLAVVSPALATAEAPQPTLENRPLDRTALPTALAAVANAASRPEQAISEALEQWAPGALIRRVELNGSAPPELLVLAPWSDTTGYLFVLEEQGSQWQVATLLEGAGFGMMQPVELSQPRLVGLVDLIENGHGPPQLVLAEKACGPSTCFTTVNILRYTDGELFQLGEPVTLASGSVYLRGRTVSLRGGRLASAGALQREQLIELRWVPGSGLVAERSWLDHPSAYFKLLDGLATADPRQAEGFFRQALDRRRPLWVAPDRPPADLDVNRQRQAVRAFAGLGLRRALAAQGKPAKVTVNDLGPYAAVLEAPDCQAVAALLQAQPSLLEPLNRFGPTQPGLTAAELCPVQSAP